MTIFGYFWQWVNWHSSSRILGEKMSAELKWYLACWLKTWVREWINGLWIWLIMSLRIIMIWFDFVGTFVNYSHFQFCHRKLMGRLSSVPRAYFDTQHHAKCHEIPFSCLRTLYGWTEGRIDRRTNRQTDESTGVKLKILSDVIRGPNKIKLYSASNLLL